MSMTPVFSGGSGRSGTTAVVNILNRHPEFCASMPRELRFVTDNYGLLDLNFRSERKSAYPARTLASKIGRDFLKMDSLIDKKLFLKRMQADWWRRVGKNGEAAGLIQAMNREDLDKILTNFTLTSKYDLKEASRELFYSIADIQVRSESSRYFADSTPVNIMNAVHINELLQGSKFINMIRDGRDVVSSVLTQRWGPTDALDGLAWWKNRIIEGHHQMMKLDKSQVMELRLEELVELNREESYQRLLNFLDLQDHPRMRKYFNETIRSEKMSQGNWKTQVPDPGRFDQRYLEILTELEESGIWITQHY